MSFRRSHLARAARSLALAAVLTVAASAAWAQAGPARAEPDADRLLRAQAKVAVVDFTRDFVDGQLPRVRSRKDACWEDLARLPAEPVDAVDRKAAYCAVYAYVLSAFDTSMAQADQVLQAPGLDQDTIEAEIRKGLLMAKWPPQTLDRSLDLVRSHSLAAIDALRQ